MRVELRDGQWADLREHITHGVDKGIKTARLKAGMALNAQEPEAGLAFDWQTVLVRAFVRSWSVNDPDGDPIPITEPDAIERAPDDIIDTLFQTASDLWLKATVPNAPTPS